MFNRDNADQSGRPSASPSEAQNRKLSMVVMLNRNTVGFRGDVDESDKRTYSHIDDVMDLIGFGKYQVYIMFATGFILMGFFCETMGISILGLAVRCTFKMDDAEVSALRLTPSLGVMSCAFIAGYLCDTYGRKKILFNCMIVSIICSTISMFCNSYTSFYILRYLTGFFVSGSCFITQTYIAEMVSPSRRAYVNNYLFLWNGFAMIYMPGTATLLARREWFYKVNESYIIAPWRVLGLVFTLPSLIGWILFKRCPESPYFNLSVGKSEETVKTLEQMSKVNLNKTLLELGVRLVGGVKQPHARRSWSDYFRLHGLFKLVSLPLLLNIFIIILSIHLVFAVNIWFTDLQNRSAYEYLRDPADKYFCTAIKHSLPRNDYTDKAPCCDSMLSFVDSLVLGSATVLTYLILGFFVLLMPRRVIFVFMLAISGLCYLILPSIDKRYTIKLFLGIAIVAPVAVSNFLWSAIMEFMPTHIRGRAVAVCHLVGRIGTIVGIKLIALYVTNDCIVLFQSIGTFVLISAIISAFMPF